MISRSLPCLLAMTACAAITAHAQRHGYRPPSAPVVYEGVNHYFMYWVHRGDTPGRPITASSTERHVWFEGRSGLVVAIAQLTLDLRRRVTADTLDVDQSGRVVAVRGGADASRGRWDFLPVVPLGPAPRVGMEWVDTVRSRASTSADQVYTAIRSYRIVRVFDSLAMRLTEIRAEGTVRFRDQPLTDSGGAVPWIDVAGPVRERSLVDLERGVLVRRALALDLSGRGAHPSTAGDTVPAGLRSSDILQRISQDRYRILSRPLPGTDSTFTVSGDSVISLHTASTDGRRAVSALATSDGRLGTADVSYGGQGVQRYRAVWTRPGDSTVVHSVTQSGNTVGVAGQWNRVYPTPRSGWAVGDPEMSDLLVPFLLTVGRDWTPAPVAVYRPRHDRWDRLEARVQPLADTRGVLIAELRDRGAGGEPTFLLFTGEGDLLYVERGTSDPTFRFPAPGSPRRDRLDSLLAEWR